MSDYINDVLNDVKEKNLHEPEYLQAVDEVLTTIRPIVDVHPEYKKLAVLERMTEPERIITFRVPWVNDNGDVIVNRGYRVQYSGLIGPYKGGLRFDPSVNQSIMKFLAFEQIFKNALTGLPIGGGKGGSDFDPKGKSDMEIMRFCQSFMTELQRHIGPDVDVPAGDIGVGAREIGYLYGQYRRIKDRYDGGVLTGKGLEYGGSLARTEATGYGLIYFMREMLKANGGQTLEGKTVTISGSGNVAIYACEKAQMLGAKVVAMSDSSGCIYDENGIDLAVIKQIKEVERKRIKEYLNYHPQAKFIERKDNNSPIWEIKTDIALPCATQNEVTLESAKKLVENGVIAIGEGANMPCELAATEYFLKHGVLVAPAKAANAGGVATSAIEMSQNSMRYYLSFEQVDNMLDAIMVNIFKSTQDACEKYSLGTNYVAGANIAAFTKLAKAMIAQGIV
ncbi:NADP-specific glutamate dehydrogenase [bacterium]|uniref:Glutamate dehydrogenase n=1 Tax=Candidatus Scatenecus faecavium TaxID=2840915 RepID=A0A9D1FX72_9BACT|nr:NADP-specific glutamate dehydrogenase [bacterium]HIS83625.1 NADP-specific glutamate dehydrogenase [Candidatus Scatenecus faecavium]